MIMRALLCGCGALALWVGVVGAASAQEPAPEAPTPVAPTHVAPAAAPALTDDEHAFFAAVGRHVTDAANAYDGYVHGAAAIDPRFGDPGAVRRALGASSAYQPQQLQEGLLAFAALIALRDQDFVDGVRAEPDPDFAERLVNSPEAVLEVPGARGAAADVMGVLRAHGQTLQAAGKAITQAAYQVQAQSWSKQPVADREQMLAGVKAAAEQPQAADEPSEKRLLQSLVATPRAPLGAVRPPPEVLRGLALAALAILGRTGDAEEAKIEVLLHDQVSADCVKLARMNLDQCLAAVGPHYDEVFCVGEHAVGETARCVSAAATESDTPATPAAAPLAAARTPGPEEIAAYGDQGPKRALPAEPTAADSSFNAQVAAGPPSLRAAVGGTGADSR